MKVFPSQLLSARSEVVYIEVVVHADSSSIGTVCLVYHEQVDKVRYDSSNAAVVDLLVSRYA